MKILICIGYLIFFTTIFSAIGLHRAGFLIGIAFVVATIWQDASEEQVKEPKRIPYIK